MVTFLEQTLGGGVLWTAKGETPPVPFSAPHIWGSERVPGRPEGASGRQSSSGTLGGHQFL